MLLFPSLYHEGLVMCSRRNALKILTIAPSSAGTPRYKKLGSLIRNLKLIVLLTVRVQHCTNLSKPHIHLHPLLCIPPSLAILPLIGEQHSSWKLACCLCILAFFVQTFQDIFHNWILQFSVLLLFQDFLSAKRVRTQFKHSMNLLYLKRCRLLQHIQYICRDF